MKEKNASKWIVMSSVVPKTKNQVNKKTQKKQPATAVIAVSRTAEKKQVESQRALPPRKKKKKKDKKRT